MTTKTRKANTKAKAKAPKAQESNVRTPKELVAGMKRSKQEITQTDIVTALTKNYPDLAPKDIHEITGIKLGTVYTIQSRLRSAHRKTPTKTANTDHMKRVEKMVPKEKTETVSKANTDTKGDLFNRLADVYLKKIEETTDVAEASKYNQLLIEVMGSLD